MIYDYEWRGAEVRRNFGVLSLSFQTVRCRQWIQGTVFVLPVISRPRRHMLLTRTHVQESISHVVDLPDDDPYILERFLQFFYTGNYEDGEYPVLHKPSLSATMTPEEVREELDQAPGIDTAGVSDENDGDYVPEEDSEDEDKEQSEMEYNDFDESGGDDR